MLFDKQSKILESVPFGIFSFLAHHLQALVVVASTIVRVCVPRLAFAELFPVAVRPVDSHKTLTLCPEHRLGGVVEPTIDEVSVKAISLADLSTEVSILTS